MSNYDELKDKSIEELKNEIHEHTSHMTMNAHEWGELHRTNPEKYQEKLIKYINTMSMMYTGKEVR